MLGNSSKFDESMSRFRGLGVEQMDGLFGLTFLVLLLPLCCVYYISILCCVVLCCYLFYIVVSITICVLFLFCYFL